MRGKNSQLSTEDVCSIIKACSLGNITELKFRDLELKRTGLPSLPLLENIYPVAEITESQHKEQMRKSLQAEEIRTREDQVRELAISDPLAYEQMLANNELEGTDDDEFDDGGSADLPSDR